MTPKLGLDLFDPLKFSIAAKRSKKRSMEDVLSKTNFAFFKLSKGKGLLGAVFHLLIYLFAIFDSLLTCAKNQ